MGCDDFPRPERDIAYDETLKLVGQLTGVASYGRDLLKVYQQRGYELTKLRAELADERAAAVEAAKSYNASCSALVCERDALLADLRRRCADEHSREGQATDSHVKAGVDGTVSVSTDHGKTWSEPESVKVEDETFTARVQATWPDGQNFVSLAAESQPVQVRKAPPEIWWSPSKRSFYGLDAEGFMFRQACEPGHEMFTGLRSVPADAVALVPARPDSNACTCRPIRGGLDVDKHCPNHGWTS